MWILFITWIFLRFAVESPGHAPMNTLMNEILGHAPVNISSMNETTVFFMNETSVPTFMVGSMEDLKPNSSLFDEKLTLLMDLQGRKPFQPRTYGSLISSLIAILLIGI